MIITQLRLESEVVRPEYIATNHWQEWVNSDMKPSRIVANIYTNLDERELDQVLNRNNKRNWKHSEKLIFAWIVRGPIPSQPNFNYLVITYQAMLKIDKKKNAPWRSNVR